MASNALYVLDTEPLIVHGITWKHVLNPVWQFGPLLQGHKAYFMLSLSWSLFDNERLKLFLLHYQHYREAFPEHEILILCNERSEADILKKFKIPCTFANHNALLDPDCYKPFAGEEKKYDAVLNSRLDRWKRHILAKKVSSLAFITYGFLNTPEEESYFRYLRKTFVNADFLNYPDGSASSRYQWLEADEISQIYSQSHTGLILSAMEGACFASCEYLLAGLPVVSTRSMGGRDVFFKPEYTTIVEPSQDAVRDAVAELKDRQLRPEDIRKATIELIEKNRSGFISAWQAIYDAEKVNRDASTEWNRKYRNKMILTMEDAETAEYLLKQVGRGPRVIKSSATSQSAPVQDKTASKTSLNKIGTNKISIVRLHQPNFPFTALYDDIAIPLYHALLRLGYEVEYVDNALSTQHKNIILGWQDMTETSISVIPPNSIIYNIDPIVAGSKGMRPHFLHAMRNFLVWDYSERNVKLLKEEYGVPDVTYIPLGYVPEMTCIDTDSPKDIDILFYGKLNPRRETILQGMLDKGLKAFWIKQTFGDDRNALIARSKVVLNMHQHVPGILENVRLGYLLANSKAVISEKNIDTEMHAGYENTCIFCPYEQLVETACTVCDDESLWKKQGERGFEIFKQRDYTKILGEVVGNNLNSTPL